MNSCKSLRSDFNTMKKADTKKMIDFWHTEAFLNIRSHQSVTSDFTFKVRVEISVIKAISFHNRNLYSNFECKVTL